MYRIKLCFMEITFFKICIINTLINRIVIYSICVLILHIHLIYIYNTIYITCIDIKIL